MSRVKISLHNVCKAFGPKVVLDDCNLDIYEGESLVILGASGSGKSVMLKCILGLITPEQGSILVDGLESVHANGSTRAQIIRKIGMLFQGAALFDSMNVADNIVFGLKRDKTTLMQLVYDKLAQVGLTKDVANLFPSDLSGGMQKRVGLARAIASRPEILFFDEPTTGLDPIMSDVINKLIVSCVKNIGATALTITHDIASARKIADRIAMLYQGKIIWIGTVKELDKTDNPYVRQFIQGSSDGPIKLPTVEEA